MPLKDLVYRCTECGHDPVEGEGETARCSDCGATFSRRPGRALVHVESKAGTHVRHPAEIIRKISELGGPVPRATQQDGTLFYETAIVLRKASDHHVLRLDGNVLGFYERLLDRRPGSLRLTDATLQFVEGESVTASWPLLQLRAVQTSSTALQITVLDDGMYELRFESDSPRRWEALLHTALQRAYAEAERPAIVEFQPRIVTR